MRYFPINLNIRGKRAVIIGGGSVAERKCLSLIQAGAQVTVIAPDLVNGLRDLHAQGSIVHLAREYKAGDLADAFLVFAATDDHATNRAAAAEAKAAGIPANIADAPEISDFTSPSVIARGELLITVSTGGKFPLLSRKIREELEGLFGPEYGAALELLGAVREKLLTEKGNNAYNRKLLCELVGHNLPVLVKNRSTVEIDHLLLKLFGPGFTLAELGVKGKDTE
ncbi:MAG: precorrin-2 dehydrogenase / sirohydrochlorin [Geobacteraceae bacterium]|nr:MAG: precorrin-2 dehydrogenase / sirohydrochlorin [Geobacteraceae bacterium]